MTYRRELDNLRARAEALEEDLVAAEAELERMAELEAEVRQLRSRLAELEPDSATQPAGMPKPPEQVSVSAPSWRSLLLVMAAVVCLTLGFNLGGLLAPVAGAAALVMAAFAIGSAGLQRTTFFERGIQVFGYGADDRTVPWSEIDDLEVSIEGSKASLTLRRGGTKKRIELGWLTADGRARLERGAEQWQAYARACRRARIDRG